MAFVGSLEVIFVVAFIAAVAILTFVRYVVRRSVDHHEDLQARCGSCGYPTTGISTFFCPECGSDLRIVGIWPRGIRPRRQISRRIWLVLWSICGLIAAIIFTSNLNAKVIPTLHRVTSQSSFAPSVPSRFARIDFQWSAQYLNWPDSINITVQHVVCDVLVLLDNGTTSQVQIDMVGSQYRITSPDGFASTHNAAFDDIAMNSWMTAIGVDVTDNGVELVLSDLLYSLLGEPRSYLRRGIGPSPPARQILVRHANSFSHTSHPRKLAISLLMLTYVLIWISGCILISRGGRIFARKSDKA